MIDSFNYALQRVHLSISQRLGIISFIPEKNKDLEYLKTWRLISVLYNDYKIATTATAVRMKIVSLETIHSSQTGYIKGRYIGESITAIMDNVSFTKTQIFSD